MGVRREENWGDLVDPKFVMGNDVLLKRLTAFASINASFDQAASKWVHR